MPIVLTTTSSGISSVGDAADDSSGKVKKLAKQLASFDEMNVLKEEDNSSSGPEAVVAVEP
jgi:hypothetical protein